VAVMTLGTPLLTFFAHLMWLVPGVPMSLPLQIESGLLFTSSGAAYEFSQALGPLAAQSRIYSLPDAGPTELLPIPPGTLWTCKGEGDCEEVKMDSFLMEHTEVTVAQFATCLRAGACKPGNFLTYTESDFCNLGAPGRRNHPVNCVNYFAAREYCQFVGRRIPTLREWQYAARGEDHRKYPWGDEEPSCLTANGHGDEGRGCGTNTTWAVGSRGAGKSAYGMMDMGGNVMEWTSTIFELPDDDPEGETVPVEDNPRTKRNHMGGSFADSPHIQAIDFLCFDSMKAKNISLGIRCVD
jgi:formylglycine-generating enzyme required for sulfatase activity